MSKRRGILPVATLWLYTLRAVANLDIEVPGGIFVVNDLAVPNTLLRPHIDRPLAPPAQLERRGVLDGLLQARQSCPTGYGACTNGGCCPLGGRCCSDYCCNAGSWCYAGGCCKDSENGCDSVSCCPGGSNCCKGGGCCGAAFNCWITSSGKKGCCPLGEVCGDGPSGECSNSGYVKCSNDDFCCPPGSTCFRDSNNAPKCRSSSSPPPPPPPPPPKTTTTKAADPLLPTSEDTPPPSTSLPPSPSSSSSAAPVRTSVPAPLPVPSPPPGSKVVGIAASDPRITYTGANWAAGVSSCNSTISSRRTTSASHSLSLQITSASAVYLNMASYNTYFDVIINGQTKRYDQTNIISSGLGNCSYAVITTTTTVIDMDIMIYVYGQAIFPRQSSSDQNWFFEFNNFLMVQPANATSSSRSVVTSLPTAASGGDSSTTSGAMRTYNLQILTYTALFSALLVLLA